MIALRALAALLSYPTADMRAALPEIATALAAVPALGPEERAGLGRLMAEIGAGDLIAAEERYVALFDRSRTVSLHLFEHLYGESRERGSAIVMLGRVYAEAGFALTGRELPDYLPVLLEYLSCREAEEIAERLGDCAHILQAIARALIARRSNYAAALQALLAIAGAERIDPAAVPPHREAPGTLDRDWEERPAFAPPEPVRPDCRQENGGPA